MGLSPLSLATVAKTALALDTVKVRYYAALPTLVLPNHAKDVSGIVFATEPAGSAAPSAQVACQLQK